MQRQPALAPAARPNSSQDKESPPFSLSFSYPPLPTSRFAHLASSAPPLTANRHNLRRHQVIPYLTSAEITIRRQRGTPNFEDLGLGRVLATSRPCLKARSRLSTKV